MEKINEGGIKLLVENIGKKQVWTQAARTKAAGKYRVVLRVGEKNREYVVANAKGEEKLFSAAAVIAFADRFSGQDIVFQKKG